MVNAENLSKSFGTDVLFKEVNFSLNSGERVGLVGRNGHGKTTLLRLIIGEEQPDTGEILFPRGYQVGYVQQHLTFIRRSLIEEACLGLPGCYKNDTWRAEKVLAGLGFSKTDMQRAPAEFSGGYQVRLNLAKVLLSRPDLLLLDEPTNFLDVVAIRWLANFLRQWPGELLLVTHDRSFMDKVITHTLGIHRKKIQKIAGTTEKYYQKLVLDEEVYEKTRRNEEKKRRETEIFISRFRAKARLANMVQSRIKTLEKQAPTERLEKIRALDFSFPYAPSPAKTPMQIEDICFAYEAGKPLIENLTLAVGRTDRIGVIGKNGSGKTTLLRVLAGNLVPTSGQRSLHNLTRIGYYAQTNKMYLHDALTVEQEIMNAGCQRQRARDICGTMMFDGERAEKTVSVLSGGEKSRVLLGKILATPANLLLLDEPTNHLDMDSCNAFLEAVDRFPGAVVLVTHNEMFLQELTHRLVVFQSDRVRLFEGSYQEFLERVGWAEEAVPGEREDAGSQSQRAEDGTGISKKELRKQRAEVLSRRSRKTAPLEKRLAEVETAIEAGEAEAGQINQDMVTASQAGDGGRIAELSRRLHALQTQTESLYQELDRLCRELEEVRQACDHQLAALEK